MNTVPHIGQVTDQVKACQQTDKCTDSQTERQTDVKQYAPDHIVCGP